MAPSKYQIELLRTEACKIYTKRDEKLLGGSGSMDKDIIELRVGNFCHMIDERFCVDVGMDNVQNVRLVMDSAVDVKPEFCGWIGKHVGPKLVELSVINCRNMTWKSHLKLILEFVQKIEVINLERNKWVDDGVVDQITLKFAKSLKELNLENTSIADHALSFIGKRCSNLRSLKLMCCPKISDKGLLQMVRKVHLSSLHISHNLQVTDVGVEALISASSNLQSIELTNCPNITDKAIESMYEAIKAWGKRRNTKSASLQRLVLKDCHQLTQQALVFLSAAVPNMRVLDLRECVNLDLTRGLAHLEGLSNLEELYVGPSDFPVEPVEVLQSTLFHAANLRVLHLIKLHGMDDDHIAEILDGTVILEELRLEEMHVGIHTVEALASAVPNLRRLHITDSNFLQDADVRCIAAICLNLEELTLRRCGKLTDGAFTRFSQLVHLRRVDLGGCSRLLDGSFLGSFTMCPLQYLNLDNLKLPSGTKYAGQLGRLSNLTVGSLRELSMQNIPQLDNGDVDMILRTFWNVSTIDLTGSGRRFPQSLAGPGLYRHPFVSLKSTHDFVGFAEDGANRVKHAIFLATLHRLKEHRMATAVKRCRRKYNERMVELARVARENLAKHRAAMATLIQARQRSISSKKKHDVRLRAGRLLVRGARRWLMWRHHARLAAAKRYYWRYRQQELFTLLHKHAKWSISQFGNTLKKVYPKLYRRVKKQTFLAMVETEEALREQRLLAQAIVLWEGHFLRKVMTLWKTLRGETRAIKKRLSYHFMLVAEEHTHNTSRQNTMRGVADAFYRSKVLVLSWLCINDDFIRYRKAETLIPLADSYWDKSFFTRVVGACFKSIVYYVESKRIKSAGLKLAPKGRRKWMYFNGLRYVFEERLRLHRAKKAIMDAKRYALKYGLKMAVCDRFIVNVYHRLHERALDIRQYEWWVDYKTKYFWEQMKKNLPLIKTLRKLEYKAQVRFEETYWARYFYGWLEFFMTEKSKEETVYMNYLMKICQKIINSFKAEVAEQRAYLNHLNSQFDAAEKRKATAEAEEGVAEEKGEEEDEDEEEEERELTEEEKEALEAKKKEEEAERERLAKIEEERREAARKEALLIFKKRVVMFQAVVRGGIARVAFQERQVNVYSALQVMQNFFRKVLARLLRRRMTRARDLQNFLNEERETNEMWRQDQFSQFYRTCFTEASLIQRVYRGWQGRVKGAILAFEISRAKNRSWYETGEEHRANLAALRAELERRLKKRQGAAVTIQKRARGMAARFLFIKVKKQARLNDCAISVQRDYRRRLAELKLRAVRRDKYAEIRFRAARAQRGMILRAFGFKKRKQQAILAIVLSSLGIDPMSYNYRFFELVQETKQDFWDFVNILKREIHIYRTEGFMPKDANNRIRARRNFLVELKIDLRVLDSCVIMDTTHPYVGSTGVVTRIDKSIPGTPLYEVKLDGHGGRQTFVHMSTDALLTYTNVQPLAKIEKKPKLRDFNQPFVLFGVNEGDPMFRFATIHAAWTIQRAFRVYRGKKIAARRRYELWQRSSDMQWSLFSHLAETNTLSTQANNILHFLGVRPMKPVFFDEVRHPTISERFLGNLATKDEKKNNKMEFDSKYRERLLFLQKSAVMEGKEYFGLGFERINNNYKLRLAFRRSFGYKRKKKSKGGTSGRKGMQAIQGTQTLVEGLATYDFKQFLDSPHIRYYKNYLYQGQWSGIPLFTPLKPHGEGLLVFFDGWGFAREEKVVYIELIACRHLNAADLDTSDPYVVVSCNGTRLQSSVKWRNLNPVYYEKFQIDATNSSAKLNFSVFDYDYIGSDDFLGQVEFKLAQFADGSEYHDVIQLRGEDIAADEDFDRGEIEVKISWAPRRFEQDLIIEELRNRKAIIIQAWARRIAGMELKKTKLKKREELLKLVRRRSVQITNTCRIHIAKRKLRRLRVRYNSCLKIQKRERIRQARNETKRRRKRYHAATAIQTIMRGFLAIGIVKRVKQERKDALNRTVMVIQSGIRRKLATMLVARKADQRRLMREQEEAEKEDDEFGEDEAEGPPVQEWLQTYGVDPEYGLRRNRRMTEKYFQKILRTPYIRLISKYGVVYVDEYPARKSDDDMLAEKQGDEPLTNREDFVGVYFPQFDSRETHRAKAIVIFNDTPHFATLHIPSSISMRESVNFNVLTIQCAIRTKMAYNAKNKILGYHKAFSKLQRIFRRRSEKQNKAAMLITAVFHLIHAKVKVDTTRKELHGSICIQCAFRCYRARCKAFDKRCVKAVSVLKYSSAIPFHGPAKALEFRAINFWMSDSAKLAEMRVEMRKVECVTEIWIMTSTLKCCPRFVSIAMVSDKKDKMYKPLVTRSEMRETRGPRWHKYEVGESMAKYYKFTFEDNYGDDRHIGVRQIRFMRAAEKSPEILAQPENAIFTEGPTVGRAQRHRLSCPAAAWPRPTYQWFRNGRLIPGATDPSLDLILKCDLSREKRSFRCLKCKMFSRNIPGNAHRVRCKNCNAIFIFKEFFEYINLIKEFHAEEADLKEELSKLLENKEQIEGTITNAEDGTTIARLQVLLSDLNERIKMAQTRQSDLLESRFSAKGDLECTNSFSDEGIYHCLVTNIRGGSIPVVRKSKVVVVVVEHSVPYIAIVKPYYRPRVQEVRKKWTTYQSILGTFCRGELRGIVTIRYSDGSFYEGPYIGEEWLDAAGRVMEKGRAHNHYGIFRCPDGRVFEGKMIDNHFDPNNLQSFYRLTTLSGEMYEGMFCDEAYHGTGLYKFADGSVYEGHWHRGTRFGHGHLRSSEGWTYEGGFNTNKRHGYGVLDNNDGSMYLGQWYYDKKEGRGVIITSLRDVYKGEVKNGFMHGFGEKIYADGSRYVGIFKGDNRHGKGIFRDADGSQYFGTFVNDRQHGEHVVKAMIPVEAVGQDNFEIRIGVYDMGEFVKWKLKYSNPTVTRRFATMFKEDPKMFDSVYSMVVAKNLPSVPEGVDRNDPEVKEILERIRNEAGGLLGQGARLAAQEKISALLVPINQTRDEINLIKKETEDITMKIIEVDKEASDLMRKYQYLMGKVDKAADRIEQFWQDDPTESRFKFMFACEQLNTVAMNEYFTFRNHRLPPPFTKKIMDSISILLGASKDWKQQQLIISNNVVNGREGDDMGLRYEFDCKLAFMMKTYNVYDYTRISEGDKELDSILCDPRLRRDSYYVESTGPAGPVLVDWIKTNEAYLEKSRSVFEQNAAIAEQKAEAYRLKAQSVKKSEEVKALTVQTEELKEKQKVKEGEVLDLDEALAKVAEMLDFIMANEVKNEEVKREDYYEEMEKRIEEKRDDFVVETCVMFLVGEVEEKRDIERQVKIREARAKGEKYEEGEASYPKIKDWVMHEVQSEQQRVIEKEGRSLGYSIIPEESALTWEETQFIIDMIVLRVVGKLNEHYNDFASALKWHTIDGKSFDSRFLYILAWKYWEADGEEAKELKACAAWEEAFQGVEDQARMSIEAKVNDRMSDEAREQGKIWAKRHKMDVLLAEQILSEQFELENPHDTAKNAFDMLREDNLGVPPTAKAQAVSWARLHPEEMNEARDEDHAAMAEQFAKQCGEKTGFTAVKIFNGFANEDEQAWEEYARHWRAFNSEEYLVAQNKLIDENAATFAEEYPDFTAMEAASIIENDTISRLVLDEEVQEELTVTPEAFTNAKCWGLRNQGILRAATAQLDAANEARLKSLWIELESVTDGWRKGSFLLLPPAAQENPDLDRFSGFRARLENRFAWVYGFLSKLHIDLFAEMETFGSKDPMGKVLHGIRPSVYDKYKFNIEESFLKHKKHTESKLADTISKISTWNSYFGVREEGEEGAEEGSREGGPSAAGSLATGVDGGGSSVDGGGSSGDGGGSSVEGAPSNESQ